jgi:hypothetical protein
MREHSKISEKAERHFSHAFLATDEATPGHAADDDYSSLPTYVSMVRWCRGF